MAACLCRYQIVIRISGVVIVAVVTLSFALRDLVWSGNWRQSAVLGTRSSTVSVPWPVDRWRAGSKGIQMVDESVYLTVRIPRAFNRVRVVLTGEFLDGLEVGVEAKPNTLAFRLVQCGIISQGRCEASIPLDSIDQQRNTVNLIIRSPKATTISPQTLEKIDLDFQRSPKTVLGFIKKLWAIL